MNEGKIETYKLYAKDFGLPESRIEEIHPGDNKAQTSRNILQGEASVAITNAAIANSAILFYLAEDLSLKHSVQKAQDMLELGRPYEILQQYAELTNGGEQ